MDIDNRSLNDRMVIYIGADDTQIQYGGGTDPRDVLVVGSIYQVEDLDVLDWSSSVRLVGVDGRFNTIFFEEEDEVEDEGDVVTRIGEVTIEILNVERDIFKMQGRIDELKNEKIMLIEKVTGITFLK